MEKEITRQEYLLAIDLINRYKKQCEDDLLYIKSSIPEDRRLIDCDTSVRLINVMQYNVKKLWPEKNSVYEINLSDFQSVSKKQLSELRLMGKKSVDEIVELLVEHNINLSGSYWAR